MNTRASRRALVGMSLAACGVQPRVVTGVPQAPPADLFFHCKAAPGYRQGRTLPLGGPSGLATGAFYYTFLNVDRARGLAPNVGVGVAGTQPNINAGFRMTVDGDRETMRYSVDNKPIASYPANTEIHFSLEWDRGHVQMRIGDDGTWSTLPVPFVPLSLSVGCSTSEVVFHGVTVTPDAPAQVTPVTPSP